MESDSERNDACWNVHFWSRSCVHIFYAFLKNDVFYINCEDNYNETINCEESFLCTLTWRLRFGVQNPLQTIFFILHLKFYFSLPLYSRVSFSSPHLIHTTTAAALLYTLLNYIVGIFSVQSIHRLASPRPWSAIYLLRFL